MDYDALKLIAERFLLPTVDDGGGSASDDSVSHTPRHAKASREREASGLALCAAGGAAAARPANAEAFLARAAAELDKAAERFRGELRECERRVEEAARLLRLCEAGAGADAGSDTSLGSEGAGVGAASPAAAAAAASAAAAEGSTDAGADLAGAGAGAADGAAAAAIEAASAATLRASEHIDDLRGFAALNLLALEKSAKKFDKRWKALLAAQAAQAAQAVAAAAAAAAAVASGATAAAPLTTPAAPVAGGSGAADLAGPPALLRRRQACAPGVAAGLP